MQLRFEPDDEGHLQPYAEGGLNCSISFDIRESFDA